MKNSKFPKGWNQERVQRVIDHYENLSEDELPTEHEAAYSDVKNTMMAVPIELVPDVRKLITQHGKVSV